MNPQTSSPVAVDPALDSTVMAKFRTHLALERTTLAWIRTALTMATFGFGIAAFFRTVEEKSPNSQTARSHEVAIWFGLALVIRGIIATVLAGISHWRTLRRLRRNEALILGQWPISITVAVLLVVIGLVSLGELLRTIFGAGAAPL